MVDPKSDTYQEGVIFDEIELEELEEVVAPARVLTN